MVFEIGSVFKLNKVYSGYKYSTLNMTLFYREYFFMSVDLVEQQIRRFLASDTPEVLAIKGGWGVGKTYSWDKYIEEFKGSVL